MKSTCKEKSAGAIEQRRRLLEERQHQEMDEHRVYIKTHKQGVQDCLGLWDCLETSTQTGSECAWPGLSEQGSPSFPNIPSISPALESSLLGKRAREMGHPWVLLDQPYCLDASPYPGDKMTAMGQVEVTREGAGDTAEKERRQHPPPNPHGTEPAIPWIFSGP